MRAPIEQVKGIKVALGPFLRSCTAIMTLGVRPAIDDYSAEEKDLLRSAARVFFPTPRFAYLFNALQIPTFPRYTTYRFQHSRVLQQILLAHVGMPHPVTRIYFGDRQKAKIPEAFPFPFIAMGPHAALHSRYFVDDGAAFEECSGCYNPLIIQEAVAWTERVRIFASMGLCGRLREDGGGASPHGFEPVSMEQPSLQPVLEMTRNFARRVQLDDIVIEWGCRDGHWQLLEMMRPPRRWPISGGMLDRHHYICELVKAGRL